ncbi:MAG: RNA 2',3'-cyclic phosphodiesterase [Candidatus Aenigmatarchaeota archaeon]
MRYFISIDIEDEDVKEGLVNFIERIEDYGDMKPVRPENLHITLLFLGELSEGELEGARKKFTDTCRNIDVGEFTCNISGVGVFPHMNYIKTIWAGAEPEEELSELLMKFSENMNGENEHDFVAHATLARLRGIGPEEKRDLKEVIESFERDFGSFRVENVRLKESELGPEGPTYRDVEVCRL